MRKTLDAGSIKKALVIRLDRVGDLVLSTPFLRNLRENLPHSRIFLVITPYTREVIEGSPMVDEILVYSPHFSSEKRQKTIAALRREHFDLAIALSPMAEAYLLASYSRAKFLAGYVYSRRWLTRFVTSFLLDRKIVFQIEEALERGHGIPHEVEQTLALLDDLGFKTKPYPLELALDQEAVGFACQMKASWAGKSEILGMHLSTKWLWGGWVLEDLKDVIRRILERFPSHYLLVTYGEQERDLAGNLLAYFEKDARIRFAGGLPFKKWAGLISICRTFVSPDTGSTHVCAALQVPVVCVYDRVKFAHTSQQWSPWKVRHRTLRKGEPPETAEAILSAAADLIVEEDD